MKITIEGKLVKLDSDRPGRVEYTDTTAEFEFVEFDEEDLLVSVKEIGNRRFLVRRDDLRKVLRLLVASG